MLRGDKRAIAELELVAPGGALDGLVIGEAVRYHPVIGRDPSFRAAVAGKPCQLGGDHSWVVPLEDFEPAYEEWRCGGGKGGPTTGGGKRRMPVSVLAIDRVPEWNKGTLQGDERGEIFTSLDFMGGTLLVGGRGTLLVGLGRPVAFSMTIDGTPALLHPFVCRSVGIAVREVTDFVSLDALRPIDGDDKGKKE